MNSKIIHPTQISFRYQAGPREQALNALRQSNKEEFTRPPGNNSTTNNTKSPSYKALAKGYTNCQQLNLHRQVHFWRLFIKVTMMHMQRKNGLLDENLILK